MQNHKKNVHLLHLGIFIHSFSVKTWITIQLYQRNNRNSQRELRLPKNGKMQFPKRGKHWIFSRNQYKTDIKKGTQTKNWQNLLMVRSRWWRYKNLLKETSSDNKTIQELVIPAFDIHNKEFGSITSNERIISNVYELRTFPDNAAILKRILCKASHPDNNPTIQFIPYVGKMYISNESWEEKNWSSNINRRTVWSYY